MVLNAEEIIDLFPELSTGADRQVGDVFSA
jgi:hypothetical protein